MKVQLCTERLTAEFSAETGALLRLASADGWEIQGGREATLFRMNLLTEASSKNEVSSASLASPSVRQENGSLSFRWDTITLQTGECLDITFTAAITVRDGGLSFEGELENHSKATVEHIAYPVLSDLCPPAGAQHFYRTAPDLMDIPSTEIFPSFQTERGYWGTEFPVKISETPVTPCILLEDGTAGLYIGCHDHTLPYRTLLWLEASPAVADSASGLLFTPQDDGTFRPRVECSATHLVFSVPESRMPLSAIHLDGYRGGWEDGMEIYRNWRKSWAVPAPCPAWAKGLHAWYQVHMASYGGGIYYRFRDLPGLGRKCAEQGIGVIQITGWTVDGQDGCLPCHDPDPRLGTWQEFKEAIAEIEAMGVRVVLYTKYTFADTRTEQFRTELHRYASRNVYGDIQDFAGYPYERPAILEYVNTHKLAVMCMCSDEWRQCCLREFRKCLELGASGMLYDECMHHSGYSYCFAPDHGHPVPAFLYAGDIVLGRELARACEEAGKPDFLLGAEILYDAQTQVYPLSYLRGTPGHKSVRRFCDPDSEFVSGFWGYNDRNAVNVCLLNRFIMEYETRHFRGEPDEFPQTLNYGKQMDALRRRYYDLLWDAEFLGTRPLPVDTLSGEPLTWGVYRSRKTDGAAAVIVNYSDETAVFRTGASGFRWDRIVSPEDPDGEVFSGEAVVPPRSAAVLIGTAG